MEGVLSTESSSSNDITYINNHILCSLKLGHCPFAWPCEGADKLRDTNCNVNTQLAKRPGKLKY